VSLTISERALAYRQDYLELMKRYKVEYALAGHLHYDSTVKYGDLTIVAGGPLSKSVAKPPVVGVRIWRVYKIASRRVLCAGRSTREREDVDAPSNQRG